MISGFNTDVECAGTVYHVQTEDKGAPHHVIMSLVYNKGTILASKREPYDTATPEKDLKERVNKQHKLICAAVKAGRIDDLKQMTADSRAGAKKAKAKVVAEAITVAPAVTIPPVPAEAVVTAPPINLAPLEIPVAPPPQARVEPQPETFAPPPPQPETPAVAPEEVQIPPPPSDPFADVPIIDAVEIIDEYAEIMADAVEVVSELSGQERPTHGKLSVDLLGDGKFRGGDRKTVSILISRGSDRKVVSGAQIMIKILGSSFRPVIFHARSDQNGLARVHLQVPQFAAGRAALLVRAIADGEEIELRKLVSPNDD
ncbi:MAG: hypothetical protein ACJ73D_10505 [Pyrinomonadaceae bacterium]